jgi:hypothetical protein
MNTDHEMTEFERRTQVALRDSVDNLDAAIRSRLTQARYAALAQHETRSSWFGLRSFAPLGAVAASVFVALLLVNRPGAESSVNESASSALFDIELLADADAYELSQETDLEFVEWAATMGDADQAGG